MFSDPQQVLDQLNISPGMHIADIGSGTGFYSVAAGKTVGAEGKVYAVDVQKDLLDKLKANADNEGVRNIQTLWGNVELDHGTKIRDNAVDIALAVNIFFQVEDNGGLAKELARITKPGGRVVVVDWTDSFGGLGPQPDAVVTAEQVTAFLESAGLKPAGEVQAGAHHYGLVFTK